jgi:hypothetical protein
LPAVRILLSYVPFNTLISRSSARVTVALRDRL